MRVTKLISAAFTAITVDARGAIDAAGQKQGNSDDLRPEIVNLRGRQLTAATAFEEVDGEFSTSKGYRAFDWAPPVRSIETAISDSNWTFPVRFADTQNGDVESVDSARLARWIKEDLFEKPPFKGGHSVLVPWPEQSQDQVGPGQYVTYSRRQVCYIVAKALVGANTEGYDNGLARLMGTCARTGGFAKSLVAYLASCSVDPTLKGGKGGPVLMVGRATNPPPVAEARNIAAVNSLDTANLRICQYDDGVPSLEGLPGVPADGCVRATEQKIGTDFMTGGLKAQATQDISASFLGGYVFGNACGLGGGQDERLMVYFPEVTALTFFLSADAEFPQLRQPAWILGARKLFTTLDGSARWNEPLVVDENVPLQSDLESIEVGGKMRKISTSRPFIAFMSENQGFLAKETFDNLQKARRNQHPKQRIVSGKDSFERQVRAWYGSMRLTSYHAHMQPALQQLVRSVGTGPWLAGLWWGDSQLGLLAVWIGHALAAPSWGYLPVDYYLYSDFTENPGNQCYVHSKDNCAICAQRCERNPLPNSSFWMPDNAFLNDHSCADAGSPAMCGTKGLEHVIKAFAGKNAGEVWKIVEDTIQGSDVQKTVFDLLLK